MVPLMWTPLHGCAICGNKLLGVFLTADLGAPPHRTEVCLDFQVPDNA
jgi:hypothetical protein